MNTFDKHYWIDRLKLSPHPEGGYYRETYRSNEWITNTALPGRFEGDRNHSTSIYFLLDSGNISAFHKIKQDELWHFHAGDSLTIHMLDDQGNVSSQKLGLNFEEDQTPQIVVPAGVYFAAEVNSPGSYVLSGCTVAPGFDFRDFEMPEKSQLLVQFPQHRNLIERLGHSAR